MESYIRNIVVGCPDRRALGSFYAELLGLRIIREDWVMIAQDERSFPRLAFGDGPAEYQPPRWPDPAHPQQLHLDFPVSNLEAAQEVALRLPPPAHAPSALMLIGVFKAGALDGERQHAARSASS